MPVLCSPCATPVKIRSYVTTCGYRTRWGRCDACLRWWCGKGHEINPREAAWATRLSRWGSERRVIVCTESGCLERWWAHRTALWEAEQADYRRWEAFVAEHHARHEDHQREPVEQSRHDAQALDAFLDMALADLKL